MKNWASKKCYPWVWGFKRTKNLRNGKRPGKLPKRGQGGKVASA